MNRVRPPSGAAVLAYQRSVYSAPGLTARIGQQAIGWPLPGRSLILLSACNPSGLRLPDRTNARRMASLAAQLRPWPYRLGAGRLGNWSEELFVVAMPLARGCVLARRYGQNAIVAIRRGQAARLVWLA